MSKRTLSPEIKVKQSPSGSLSCQEDAVLLEHKPPLESLRIWKPTTLDVAPSTSCCSHPKKARLSQFLMDSGSNCESEPDKEDDTLDVIAKERLTTRKLRDNVISFRENVSMQQEERSEEMSKRTFGPEIKVEQSPSGSLSCQEDAVLLERTPPLESLRIWKPTTPDVAPSTSSCSHPKKARLSQFLMDSGSECESEPDKEDDTLNVIAKERLTTRKLRDKVISFRENVSMQQEDRSEEMSKRTLSPEIKVKQSPSGSLSCQEDAVLLEHPPPLESLRIWKPTTPDGAPSTSSCSHPKKARLSQFLMDSGSECESEPDEEDDTLNVIAKERLTTRNLRDNVISFRENVSMQQEERSEGKEGKRESEVGDQVRRSIGEEGEGRSKMSVQVERREEMEDFGLDEGLKNFVWSEDYSTFTGQAETYLRSPGPTIDTHDPVQTFRAVWDDNGVAAIVNATNKYAWQIIGPLSEIEGGIPKSLQWTDTSVSEMYRYFAMLILMTLCYRSKINEYWTTGILQMPEFRELMPRNRFLMISRFLHFSDNDVFESSTTSYQKKISKIRPILEHCNSKFASLYIPDKHLSLDESLLLWKGRLSWVQCIRSKAARFGIKSFELCEAKTGYQLRSLLYAGKNSSMIDGGIYGFDSCSAKVVLELMDGFLDVGHTLVMDNWYNQLPMTRFLKRRHTDIIGTLNPRRVHVPDDIRCIDRRRMARGQVVARHCGDISLVAWNDVKLVTAMSTCHSNDLLPTQRAGQEINKPASIVEYNKYMGGVDSKDQKLSMFLLERKRGQKWYIKVFKRMLNISLLNTFIIHNKNAGKQSLAHREFRFRVALGLLVAFPNKGSPSPNRLMATHQERRLLKADHFVVHTELAKQNPKKRTQMRCVRCTAAGHRTMVTVKCTFCDVPLCVGPCWSDYHTLVKLK